MTRPQPFRPCMTILSESDTARIVAFIKKVGTIEVARARLGMGRDVFDAARAFGKMQTSTRDRLLTALAREEAA